MMSLVLLSSVAFTTNTLYAQSYYKWIDAQGSTHYTKTPPPKGAKKQGKVDTYSSTSSTSAATSSTTTPPTPATTSSLGSNSSPASAPATAPAISSESSKRDITDRSNPTMKTPARTASSSTF
ncbi:DUF4124 domain-containing protein [Acinetobacter soli]|uniref:DUF4124 domain-containing protein n=1 Tax=Acinetobacter soli TaxID=487316 RepID=UPI001BC87765